jgi:cysteine/histidine-rich domain-containing protein 1
MKRPLFNSPQIKIKPTITPMLLDKIKNLAVSDSIKKNYDIIVVGQSCKRNCCKDTYEGPESNNKICTYHSGTPVFHEGIKYWSCCKKKTTDFTAFLEQPGCQQGNHIWIQKVRK